MADDYVSRRNLKMRPDETKLGATKDAAQHKWIFNFRSCKNVVHSPCDRHKLSFKYKNI